MSTTKQYEVCFTENNQEQWFTDYIINIETARIAAKSFERSNEKSNVRILEMSNFDRTIKFIL
ncbi:hypothetical protein LGK95_13450 [Clostridium algoriphilum]|uniref:hypothetical protein n=1 Tax=Clostridium algoriphilum TaxID=198347 RepID=UPI001CF3BA11|nr:hypothetical protein [Clostridium algoriphilum]MCB2294514.1 hypothetical protein [Clostridium algoriphilum]